MGLLELASYSGFFHLRVLAFVELFAHAFSFTNLINQTQTQALPMNVEDFAISEVACDEAACVDAFAGREDASCYEVVFGMPQYNNSNDTRYVGGRGDQQPFVFEVECTVSTALEVGRNDATLAESEPDSSASGRGDA